MTEFGHIRGFERVWDDPGTGPRSCFAEGGIRSALVLGDMIMADTVVFTGSALDALKLADRSDNDDTLYVSIAGGLGDGLAGHLVHLISNRRVVLAFADDPEDREAERVLRALCPEADSYQDGTTHDGPDATPWDPSRPPSPA